MKNSFKRIYDPQNDTKNDTKIQRCEKTSCWLKTQRMRGEKMKENSAVSMKSALERVGKGFTTQGDRIKHEKTSRIFPCGRVREVPRADECSGDGTGPQRVRDAGHPLFPAGKPCPKLRGLEIPGEFQEERNLSREVGFPSGNCSCRGE